MPCSDLSVRGYLSRKSKSLSISWIVLSRWRRARQQTMMPQSTTSCVTGYRITARSATSITLMPALAAEAKGGEGGGAGTDFDLAYIMLEANSIAELGASIDSFAMFMHMLAY